MGLTGKVRVSAGQLREAACAPWLIAPSSVSKASNGGWSPFLVSISDLLFCVFLSSPFLRTGVMTLHAQIS